MTGSKSRCVLAVLSIPLVAIGLLISAGEAAAQSTLQYTIVTDQYGNVVGQLANNGITIDSPNASVSILTYSSIPAGVSMSTLAPAITGTPTTVAVKVPSSARIGFCTYSNYYSKSTGLCGDGRFPWKIIPVGSLSDPAAQVPNIPCTAPRVPTFYPSTATSAARWVCIVPPGFKLSM